MEITVSGESYVEVAPEFGRLYLTATSEDADKAKAARLASERANELSGAMREAGARNIYVEPLRVNSWSDGKRVRNSASVSLRAEFTDTAVLASFQAHWGGVAGVDLGWVSWELTEKTSREREGEVLAGALAEASRRARSIADAAGRGDLTVLQVSDPGMMSDGGGRDQMAVPVAMMSRSFKGAPEVAVVPENVRVSARLDVRFRAD